MNKLTKRLATIASLVSGKVVADVGCDHGKLSEILLENHIVDFAYVSDISAGSLQKAIDLLTSKNHKFKAICTDGLLGFKDINDIDECIIAGMGGNEIINIVKSAPITIDSYILSPQHNIIEAKKYMISRGYAIDYDIIVKDKHKFYNIFRCKLSDKIHKYSEFELMFGRDNFTDQRSDLNLYIDSELKKINDIINRVDEETKKCLNEKCEFLNTAKKELNNYE